MNDPRRMRKPLVVTIPSVMLYAGERLDLLVCEDGTVQVTLRSDTHDSAPTTTVGEAPCLLRIDEIGGTAVPLLRSQSQCTHPSKTTVIKNRLAPPEQWRRTTTCNLCGAIVPWPRPT